MHAIAVGPGGHRICQHMYVCPVEYVRAVPGARERGAAGELDKAAGVGRNDDHLGLFLFDRSPRRVVTYEPEFSLFRI